MDKEEIKSIVCEIVKITVSNQDIVHTSEIIVNPSSKLKIDLGLDSLALAELAVRIETRSDLPFCALSRRLKKFLSNLFNPDMCLMNNFDSIPNVSLLYDISGSHNKQLTLGKLNKQLARLPRLAPWTAAPGPNHPPAAL